jgi:hypothetical protein
MRSLKHASPNRRTSRPASRSTSALHPNSGLATRAIRLANRKTAPVNIHALGIRTAAVSALAIGALAVGALSIGAMAIGALAIGRLAIGRLAIGRTRLRSLEIDRLTVRHLSLPESPRPFAAEL